MDKNSVLLVILVWEKLDYTDFQSFLKTVEEDPHTAIQFVLTFMTHEDPLDNGGWSIYVDLNHFFNENAILEIINKLIRSGQIDRFTREQQEAIGWLRKKYDRGMVTRL